jgi:hypothetical protein
VVTVTALSDGLDDAQQKVLRPLTGVGTDMSVNRPVKARGGSFGPVGGSRLPSAEQDQLRKCASGRRRQAVLSQSYADRQKLSVGDTFALKAHTYHVVGLAEAPLGRQASDVYIPLKQLQELSGREGRINVLQVRADNSDVAGKCAHARLRGTEERLRWAGRGQAAGSRPSNSLPSLIRAAMSLDCSR